MFTIFTLSFIFAAPIPAETKPVNRIVLSRYHQSPISFDPDGTKETEIPLDQFGRKTDTVFVAPGGRMAVFISDQRWIKPSENSRVTFPRGNAYFRKLMDDGPGEKIELKPFCGKVVWSRDGQSIIFTDTDFTSFNEKLRNFDRYIVSKYDLEKKTFTPVSIPGGHRVLDVSPDGKSFLTVKRVQIEDNAPQGRAADIRYGVFQVRIGEEPILISDTDRNAFFAHYSPDGKMVVIGQRAWNPGFIPRPDIVAIELITKRKVKIEGYPIAHFCDGLCWSPDGKQVAIALSVIYPKKGEPPVKPHFKPGEPYHVVFVANADGTNGKIVHYSNCPQLNGIDWK